MLPQKVQKDHWITLPNCDSCGAYPKILANDLGISEFCTNCGKVIRNEVKAEWQKPKQ